ncbi:MAG: hypothetical protein ACJ73S_24610 [Mycobacteriales bacterium]
MDGERRHRRRTRRGRARPDAAPPPPPPAIEEPPAPPLEPAEDERALRSLIGSGRSRVGVIGAMRARDVSRPGPEDYAAADENIVLVRRHYVPPEGQPGSPGNSPDPS